MSRKKTKKRWNKRKFFFRLATIALVIYAAYHMVHNLMNPFEKYSLDYGDVNVEETYTSFVMRHETMVSTQNGGAINYFIQDGERVKRGHKVADITVQEQGTPVAEATVLGAEEREAVVSVSEEMLSAEIAALRDEIIDRIQTQELFKIAALKEELLLKQEKLERLSKSNDIKGLQSKPYSETVVGTVNAINGQVLDVRSPESGIVTFTSDGYEEILNIENLYDIDYSQLASQPIQVKDLKTDYVSAGSPLYKLIDNSVWYVVALIGQEEIKPYKDMTGDAITVTFNQDKIVGEVFDVFETGNQTGALVIQLKNQATGFYSERKTELKITRENYRGLKVPKDAIIKKDGIEGVYVLGYENKVKFVPIKGIGMNDEEVIVQENNFYEKQNDDVVEVRTVQQYNIVIRNPQDSIAEGDVIY